MSHAIPLNSISLLSEGLSQTGLPQTGSLPTGVLKSASRARAAAVRSCAKSNSGLPPKPAEAGERAPKPKAASYLARAECGAVECTGRGCRPVLGSQGGAGCPEAQVPRARMEPPSDEHLRPVFQSGLHAYSDAGCFPVGPWSFPSATGGTGPSAACTPRSAEGCSIEMWSLNGDGESVFTLLPCADHLLPSAHTSRAQAKTPDFFPHSKMESLGCASDSGRLLELAEYTWRQMGDLSRAELLFEKALEKDPGNPTALASYALFLWEFEASHSQGCLI